MWIFFPNQFNMCCHFSCYQVRPLVLWTFWIAHQSFKVRCWHNLSVSRLIILVLTRLNKSFLTHQFLVFNAATLWPTTKTLPTLIASEQCQYFESFKPVQQKHWSVLRDLQSEKQESRPVSQSLWPSTDPINICLLPGWLVTTTVVAILLYSWKNKNKTHIN